MTSPDPPEDRVGLGDKVKAAFAGGSGFAKPGDRYDAEVNKGSLNMGAFTAKMNQRWQDGWRLAHVFEQDGNTAFVWERRDGG